MYKTLLFADRCCLRNRFNWIKNNIEFLYARCVVCLTITFQKKKPKRSLKTLAARGRCGLLPLLRHGVRSVAGT